jgi:phosphomannomutase
MNPDWRKLRSGTDVIGTGDQLTDEFAAKLGYAFALYLARQANVTPDGLVIAIGHDSRESGPRLARALIKGVTAADSDVLDAALCTAPALYAMQFAGEGAAHGAIMVTASSLGAGMNGFKLMTRAGAVSAEDAAEILDAAATLKLPVRLVTPVDSQSSYREYLAAMARERLEDDALRPLLGLHVIVDAGNGAGGFYAEFLEELGAEVTGSMNLEPDGKFPAHIPDALDAGALNALSKAVVDQSADMGVMFDADCARAAVVDERGRVITGNRLIALISAVLLDKDPGATIVTDSVTSSGLSRFITEWGGVHYRFKRGYRNVIEEAQRLNEEGINCPVAIETSGHAALRENNFSDDGMYLVTRLICEAYDRKRSGLSLFTLIDELSEPVESAEIRLQITDADTTQTARDVTEMVLSHTLDNPEWLFAPDSREGVRILFNLDGGVENAWFQLRVSVRDPAVMVLNAESDVPGGVRKMLGEFCALVEDECDIDLAPVRDYLA